MSYGKTEIFGGRLGLRLDPSTATVIIDIDSDVDDDVQKSMRDLIGAWAASLGVRHLKVVHLVEADDVSGVADPRIKITEVYLLDVENDTSKDVVRDEYIRGGYNDATIED